MSDHLISKVGCQLNHACGSIEVDVVVAGKNKHAMRTVKLKRCQECGGAEVSMHKLDSISLGSNVDVRVVEVSLDDNYLTTRFPCAQGPHVQHG